MGWSGSTHWARGTTVPHVEVERLYEDDWHQKFFESIHNQEDA